MSLISRRTLMENSAKGGLGPGRRRSDRRLRWLVVIVFQDVARVSGVAADAQARRHDSRRGDRGVELGHRGSQPARQQHRLRPGAEYLRRAGVAHAECSAVLQARAGDDAQQGRVGVDDSPAQRGDLPQREGVHRRRSDLLDQPRRQPQVSRRGRQCVERDQRDWDEEARQRYTVSVPFATPYSTFVQTLANSTTVFIVPVGFNPKKPIGTGPFKLASFTPGQQTVFARYENYWDSPLPYLDKVR